MKPPVDYRTFYNVHDMLDKLEELKQQNAALVEALEDNMNWIGPPPVDKYSYDSLREDAWAKGKAAIARVEGGEA